MKPPNELSALEAADALAAGTLTSEQLMAACLERVAARDAEIGAWIHLDPEQALAAARARDRAPRQGPLHGLPVGIKDIIDTADMPTAYGTPIYEGNRPAWDAACVALVRAAGGVVMGKTVTTEFAGHHPGKTANPHNTAHTPGGSSSGSAAAVADFMVPLAFGTQTGGSVIRPASFSGVVGYKATHGALSLAGVKWFAPSLDSLGVMARSVADAALMRAALAGAPATLASLERPPAIGLCRTPQWEQADAATQSAVENSARNLARTGAEVRDVELPDLFAELIEVHASVMTYESARSFAHEYRVHGGALSENLTQVIEMGHRTSLAEYAAALEQAERGRRALVDVMTGLDVLLVPAAPGEAPLGLEFTGDPLFNRIWTLLHVPAVALPGHTGPNGLPVGIQVVGPVGGDDRMLAVAAWMESRIL